MNKVYLLTGGNIPDRYAYMEEARDWINKRLGKIIQESAIYETEAWGPIEQAAYLNQVLLIHTTLSPEEVLEGLQAIELLMGRKRKEKWGARVIDIDILFYNDDIINTPRLKIPHPWIAKRNFTLVPLLEIAPTLQHPVTKKSIAEIAELCEDLLDVKHFILKETPYKI